MVQEGSRTANSVVLGDLVRFGPTQSSLLESSEAAKYTRRIAQKSNENFHVLGWLVPKRIAPDIANLYAYCRWADDLADEVKETALASELLAWWRGELRSCYAGKASHPVFVALRETVVRHDLPIALFEQLIDAFDQDQRQRRYEDWSDLLCYCSRSANPVGRLYLMICGYRDDQRFILSDQTCTALQLVNFWQDVRRDLLDRDRIYIPRDIAATHQFSVDDLRLAVDGHCAGGVESAYRKTIQDLIGRTQVFFEKGRSLLPLLNPEVRPAIRLFTLGGEAVLRKIVRAGYATHLHRPRLGRFAKAALLASAWFSGRSSLE